MRLLSVKMPDTEMLEEGYNLDRDGRKRYGWPATNRFILSGELCPSGDLAQVTSREAYVKWLDYYNHPMPPTTLVKHPRLVQASS